MIQEKNKLFYDSLFPPIQVLLNKPNTPYRTNNIQFKSVLIYGKIGSGKTEMVRKIAEEAVSRYGADKVSASINEDGEIKDLLDQGLTEKLVNIIFVDNVTLKKYDTDQLHRLFRIRQEIFERTGREIGLIVAIITTHRFHASDLSLRTNNDIVVIRDRPSNPYDKNVIKRMIGQEGLDQITYYVYQRKSNDDYKKFSVFVAEDEVGILETPLATNNYLKEVQSLQALLDKARMMQRFLK